MLTNAKSSAPGPKSVEKLLWNYNDLCLFWVRSYACETFYELIVMWQLGKLSVLRWARGQEE